MRPGKTQPNRRAQLKPTDRSAGTRLSANDPPSPLIPAQPKVSAEFLGKLGERQDRQKPPRQNRKKPRQHLTIRDAILPQRNFRPSAGKRPGRWGLPPLLFGKGPASQQPAAQAFVLLGTQEVVVRRISWWFFAGLFLVLFGPLGAAKETVFGVPQDWYDIAPRARLFLPVLFAEMGNRRPRPPRRCHALSRHARG
jgi:hypothetical protein